MSTEMQTKVQASPAQNFTPIQTGLLQRKSALCNIPGLVEDSGRDKEKVTLQRSSVDQAGTTTVPPIVHEALRSPGQPLDAVTRTYMEPRFGHNFSQVQVYSAASSRVQTQLTFNKPGDTYEQEADRVAERVMYASVSPSSAFGFDFNHVRVHTDDQAAASARSVNALAYTVGHDIIFAKGQYAPHTTEGRHLLAHELTHVVQQQRDAFPAGGMVQRAISQELDKIESLFSYGFLDWAITDEEAIEALELLKTLPKYQQAVFVSNKNYLNLLRDNLPESRLPELNDIEKGVTDIRPPSSEIEDIRSKLSDKEAIAALEKLKKLSGTQLAVALGSINYSRLLDNLPDDRKQELIDLMAKNLATGGVRTAEEQTHPGAILSNISFKSDHGVLKDNTSDWSSGGSPYGEPEWFIGPGNKAVSKPISQKMGTQVTAEVSLNVLPLTATPAPITLRGESDESFLEFNFNGMMQGGMGQKVLLTSIGNLRNEIKAFPDQQIRWRMKWRDWDHEIAQTSHTIFTTMNTPRESEDGAITYKRMAKAIKIVEPLGLAPHNIVKGIMRNWNQYSLKVPIHDLIWTFADQVEAGGQCIDIVRFVRAIIEMIGCLGISDAVVVWADPATPTIAIEQPWVGTVGLHTVAHHSAHHDWQAALLDHKYKSNAYEAALKFDYGDTMAYYAGGAGIYTTKQEVLEIFRCLAWVKWTDGRKCQIMEVRGSYKGGCAVGAEHECYV